MPPCCSNITHSRPFGIKELCNLSWFLDFRITLRCMMLLRLNTCMPATQWLPPSVLLSMNCTLSWSNCGTGRILLLPCLISGILHLTLFRNNCTADSWISIHVSKLESMEWTVYRRFVVNIVNFYVAYPCYTCTVCYCLCVHGEGVFFWEINAGVRKEYFTDSRVESELFPIEVCALEDYTPHPPLRDR